MQQLPEIKIAGLSILFALFCCVNTASTQNPLIGHQMLIKNTAYPQKVLDVASSSSTAGAQIWQFELNQSQAQKFVFMPADNGYYYIITVAGNLYVTVDVPPLVVGQAGATQSSNYSIKQDVRYPTPTGTAVTRKHPDQQKWKLTSTGNVGTYFLQSKGFRGKLLQSESAGSRAKVALADSTGKDAQRWYIGRADVSPEQGGGDNYGYWVKNYTKLVRTPDELINALSNAKKGDVIYVNDLADIDLKDRLNNGPIRIPEGVTLASGRGRGISKGGIIRCSTKGKKIMFQVTGDFVRITGLQIIGPDFDADGEQEDIMTGVLIKPDMKFEARDILVDNNEISGWQDIGVGVQNVKNVRILQNTVHHNLYVKGLLDHIVEDGRFDHFGGGYGIEVRDFGGAEIERNLFHDNRHDIASTGHKECTYSAIKNLVLGGGISHSFDVHAWKENQCEDQYKHANGYAIAGHTFLFRDNIFKQDHNEAIQIRGVPMNLVTIQNNSFKMKEGKAVYQFKKCGIQKYIPGVSWVKDKDNFVRINMIGNRFNVED